MQNKRISEFILLPVPLEDYLTAGIGENSVLQTYVEGNMIIIQAASQANIVCDGDCEHCPINETDCEGACKSCPCFNECDEDEVDDNE